MIESNNIDQDDAYSQVQLKQRLEKHQGYQVRITGVKSFSNVVALIQIIKSVIPKTHSRAIDFNKLLDMDKLSETVIKYIRTEINETS